MEDFTTTRPVRTRGEGSGLWSIGAFVLVLLLVLAIIGLGSASGTDPGAPPVDAASPSAATPVPPAPAD